MKPEVQSNTLAGFIEEAAKKYGNRPALEIRRRFRMETLTYDALLEKSYQTARFLTHHGVKPGDTIIAWSYNMPEWVALYFGAFIARAVVVPVDFRVGAEVCASYVRECGTRIAFGSFAVREQLARIVPNAIALEELFMLIKDFATTPLAHEAEERDPAEIVYTSGTTSKPKGVVLTHGNIVANLRGVLAALPPKPHWRFLSVLPLSHMYEQTAGLLAPLAAGLRITYVSRLSSVKIREAMRERRVTTVIAVPEFLKLLLEGVKREARAKGKEWLLGAAFLVAPWLPFRVRRVLFFSVHKELGGRIEFFGSGGAPLDASVARAWELMGVYALEGYGLTETSPVVATNTFRRRKIGTVGKPLEGVAVRLDAAGQILVRGKNVFREYFRNPEATRDAFADGWFKTGDIGELDREGYLRIRGRTKFVIVLPSGLKVFPEDVEQKLLAHPLVKDACVIPLQHERGEQVHAILILKTPTTNLGDIIAQVNRSLEPHQQIISFGAWPDKDFPRTRLFKVDRLAVSGVIAALRGGGKPPEKRAARDTLTDLVAHVTHNAPDALREDTVLTFAGLDSLRRIELISLIEDEFGIAIPETGIGPHTTLRDLRQMIAEGAKASSKFHAPPWPHAFPVRILREALQRSLLFPLIAFFVRADIAGRENLNGVRHPAIFIFNHVSHLEVPLILKTLPFRIRWNTRVAQAQDYNERHTVHAFISMLFANTFPFARSGQIAPSLEYVARMLDGGSSLLIAPEGEISPSGKLLPFKTGIGFMAVESGLPVVPVKTEGLERIMPSHRLIPVKRGRASLRIGEPVVIGKEVSYADATRQLEDIMRRL